jgi:hypothetical protein
MKVSLNIQFNTSRLLPFRCLVFVLLLGMFNAGDVLAQHIKEDKISIRFDNIPLKEVLRKIETAGSLVISYVDDDFDPTVRVSGIYDNKTIAQILTAVLDKYDLNFRFSGNNVFVGKKEKQKKKGILVGQVKDRKSGEQLLGVMVKAGNTGTQTDATGNFRIELQPGLYKVEISYMGYHTVTENVTIAEERETHLAVTMSEDANSLNEVIVSNRKVTGTNKSLIAEIRSAQSVVSGISREQIARSQDRDGAEVVRRIPGVSIMQNRFVVVRGLPQRYNTVMLNNAIAPSFEADSRAFSFDIMPSSMIDRVMVYKTAVPELPGDFAGGVVKVYTTGMPATNSLNITYQASVRPNTTFKNFYEQPQGKYTWLGYDDGTYAMPEGVPSLINRGDRKNVTPLFNSNWDARGGTAPIDHRFSLDFSRRMRLASNVKLGVIGGLGYTNTHQYSVVSRNIAFTPKATAYNFVEEVYAHNVRLNGLLNVSMDIGNKHRIDFKNLYTHMSDYEYIDRKGMSGPYAGEGTGLLPGLFLHQMTLTNAFRDIFSSQLNGSHDLFKNTKLKWLAGYTKSHYDDPDQRRRTQMAPFVGNEQGAGKWDEPYSNTNGVNYNFWSRLYYKLPEESKTFGLDLEQKINIGSSASLLKAGMYLEGKARSFELRVLGLLIDDPKTNEVLMGESTRPVNTYSATNDLMAGYIAMEIPFLKRFKFYGGARVEDNRQQLHSHHWQTNGPDVGPVNLDNHKLSLLPSANLSFNITGNSLVRAAYSQTLNRPEFREIAPFFFYDLRTFSSAYGNIHMKPQTDIHNYDLRYEWYPSAGEMFNIGVFYKKFLNPIEYFFYNSTSGSSSYMWGNAKEAINYGAEMDMILSLGRITNGNSAIGKILERTTLLLNAAYIFSRVDLGDQTISYQERNRPLFGQSPYTINASLNYTQEAIGLKLNLAYNIIGKRLIVVGNDLDFSIYELPRHSLDGSFSKSIGKLVEVKGGVQNILNARHLQMQDSDRNGKLDRTGGADYTSGTDNRNLSWYSGTYYTLGVGLRL